MMNATQTVPVALLDECITRFSLAQTAKLIIAWEDGAQTTVQSVMCPENTTQTVRPNRKGV